MDLVLIDVLVRDGKGNPVPGLSQGDFQLRIDDRPAEISTFENYCTNPVSTGKKSEKAAGEVPPASSSASAPAPGPRRHIVLFFDINQLSEKGRDRSVDASLEFVRERMNDRDRVMLVTMKGEPRLVENFTSDKERLIAHLTSMRGDPEMIDRHYLEERLNISDILNRECGSVGGECTRRLTVAVPYAEEEMHRTKRSLDAVRNLMPALGALQGRKTLVHFSESLRDEPGLQYLVLAGTTPAAQGLDIRMSITELHKDANAAGVSLYMVWAAGLGEKGSLGMADASLGVRGGLDVGRLQDALIGGEDAALALTSTLALETGGVATQRTNDLGLAFDAVAQDLSCYYVLGYTNPGPGDGRRHMIKLAVSRKGLRLRHRPYFEDWSEEERLDRRFRSALMAPAYFDRIAVKAEAYALAPEGKKTPILLKASFPLDAVTVIRQPDETLYGEAEVRTTVWMEGRETCLFTRLVPVTVRPGEETPGRSIIYESGCELEPGEHEFTVAVLDRGSWEIGASGASLRVPARSAGIFGDVVLWTSSGSDILSAEDAESIGIQTTGSGHGFVPRSERRFGTREPVVLYAVVCPPEDAHHAGEIRVSQSLLSGELEVASFPEVVLRPEERSGGEGTAGSPGTGATGANGDRSGGTAGSSPPGPAGGGSTGGPRSRKGACEGVFSKIPPGHLGPGGYTFRIEIEGLDGGPLLHEAGIAVSEDPSGAR